MASKSRAPALQAASEDIWRSKYRLTDKEGTPIDKTVDDSFKRVAKALAECEVADVRQHWEARFLWAQRNGAIPAGRIMSNAGAGELKPSTSLINCTVSGTVEDSMIGILDTLHDAGVTLKAGCGIGYCFSPLRPKGAYVAGAGASTHGPLPFMDVFDKLCFTIASSGGRRGAQMGTFDVSHPDVEDFIKAKREDGRLRNFNLSLLITESFVQAVNDDADWPLVFPVLPQERDDVDFEDPKQVVWRPWPTHRGCVVKNGLVACRVYRVVKAKDLWDKIMRSTYNKAEPGFLLIDRINLMNNNWWCEEISATNPCGEQALPPNGACLLGSVNLTSFVRRPFEKDASFDMETYREVVAVFTRMLDNVVEVSNLPVQKQREEIMAKRRHGMGYLGLGSTLTMLGMRYGSPESVEFTDMVSREMAVVGWRTALELSKEKGPAPILAEKFDVTDAMLAKRPEMAADGLKVGDKIKGSKLHARYSRYMQQIAQIDPELVDELAEHGARFTHHTSIAPTGTISLSIGNNASNGIEPSFAHEYWRNVIVTGKKTKEKVAVRSFEYLTYLAVVDGDADLNAKEGPHKLPDSFVEAGSITPHEHVVIQAAAQKWVDSSISKTINVATDIPYEDFQGIYLEAVKLGLKGCTTFRFNPEAFQGVLVKENDLANTTYRFELDDGSVVEVKGNEQVEYDGETHTAANLYDALKEGTYGKF